MPDVPPLPPGVPRIPIDPHTMVHTDDPLTSHLATYKVKHGDRAKSLVEAIRKLGGYRSLGGAGCISDDLQEHYGISDQREDPVAYSGITGYFAKLERLCWIERTGATRAGHRFGRQQEIIWALTDEEREAKLLQLEKNLGKVPSWTVLTKIAQWFEINERLKLLQAQEEALREEIIETLIPDALIDKYRVPLGPSNGVNYELRINVLKRETRMEIRPIKT